MNVYIVYPKDKNDEAYLNIENNAKKINAMLFYETVIKKPYSDELKLKILKEMTNPVALTSIQFS